MGCFGCVEPIRQQPFLNISATNFTCVAAHCPTIAVFEPRAQLKMSETQELRGALPHERLPERGRGWRAMFRCGTIIPETKQVLDRGTRHGAPRWRRWPGHRTRRRIITVAQEILHGRFARQCALSRWRQCAFRTPESTTRVSSNPSGLAFGTARVDVVNVGEKAAKKFRTLPRRFS